MQVQRRHYQAEYGQAHFEICWVELLFVNTGVQLGEPYLATALFPQVRGQLDLKVYCVLHEVAAIAANIIMPSGETLTPQMLSCYEVQPAELSGIRLQPLMDRVFAALIECWSLTPEVADENVQSV